MPIAQPSADDALPPAVGSAPQSCEPADQTLTLAQSAFVKGEFSESLRLAKLCVKESPARSYRVIGAAACNLHDVEGANLAYRHLDSSGRQYLVYACARQDLSYDPGQGGFSMKR
jgi:hypothetical protein